MYLPIYLQHWPELDKCWPLTFVKVHYICKGKHGLRVERIFGENVWRSEWMPIVLSFGMCYSSNVKHFLPDWMESMYLVRWASTLDLERCTSLMQKILLLLPCWPIFLHLIDSFSTFVITGFIARWKNWKRLNRASGTDVGARAPPYDWNARIGKLAGLPSASLN